MEAQRFSLVQNVAEMQNQVADLEIEVRHWHTRGSSHRSLHRLHLPLRTSYRELRA
jgi:DNA-binding ferritin-like protein